MASERYAKAIEAVPATAAYLRPGGRPLAKGAVVRNPAYARTLRAIAQDGPSAFYSGEIARAIVEAVRKAPRNPAELTLADLERYRTLKRPPVCGDYRAYRVCGMGPPSSGGIAVLQVLELLERFDLSRMAPDEPRAVHLMAEAQRLAFADRSAWLADSDFVPVPVRGLLAPSYLAERSRLISPARILDRASLAPGNPPESGPILRYLQAPDNSRPSTAHVSIIDGEGNVAAMTTTVEGPFGSYLMAAGFILNNQLTDFSFEPARDNRRVANAPGPGKRPLSSMSPTIVFDPAGRVFAVLGSPGGWQIVPYVSKTLVALIDWKRDAATAAALPNISGRNANTDLEMGPALDRAAQSLAAMGHQVRRTEQTSGVNLIRVTPEGFDAAADPRREGRAAGD